MVSSGKSPQHKEIHHRALKYFQRPSVGNCIALGAFIAVILQSSSHLENAPSISSPNPRNATRPLLLNTSQIVSALNSYPLLRHRAFSQSASASAEQLKRLVSHSCRMRSMMGWSGIGSGFATCRGTDERGKGSARGGNIFSYAVRKWSKVCSVCGRDASVRPKGWPLSFSAERGHAAVG
jgi:hypothetical protein